MKKLLSLLTFATLFFASFTQAYAVPVRTYQTVNSQSGSYYLRSENGGNGNLNPGSTVTVDSYLFQCRSKGSAACSTEWNSDAVFIKKWQDQLVVPQLNNQTYSVLHHFNLPYGNCGRIQYDQGIVGIEGAIGGKVYDFGIDCGSTPVTPSPITTPQPNSCSTQMPIDTQFRRTGTSDWKSGNDITALNLKVGDTIDINCFAKGDGTHQLENGQVIVIYPGGRESIVSNQAQLNNFSIQGSGTYTFTCKSTTINNCQNSDSFSIQNTNTGPRVCNQSCGANRPCGPGLACINNVCKNVSCIYDADCVCNAGAPNPTPTPTVQPTPTPNIIPTVTPVPRHESSCEDLQVVGGNDSLVPAKVTLRARGADSTGSIQKYRFFFGDGEQQDSDTPEVTHEYKSSGTFIARADVRDSQGNWKTSNSCQDTVTVKASSIESHRSDCSNVFITANNNGRAPSTVQFEVTGYDNKGDIQGYRVDFGNGITKDSTGRTLEQRYETAGTYEVHAYIKDSSGNYVGGDNGCNRTLTLGSTRALTTQPATGTPTALPVMGFSSSMMGIAIQLRKKFAK